MNVDNSGPTLIFDEKTKEAIEAGKNRITLLQAEELRFNKLIHDLKAEVVKHEGELAYKQEQADSLEKKVAALKHDADTLTVQLKGLIEERDYLVKEATDREESLREREVAVFEREKAAENTEKMQAEKAKLQAKQDEKLTEEALLIATKKQKIEELLKDL